MTDVYSYSDSGVLRAEPLLDKAGSGSVDVKQMTLIVL